MVTLVNRAKMSTSTTGTGTITLGSAETGYQSFADAGVADGDVVRYVIEDGNDWEIGSGTYTATGTTLTRTVDESSNSDAALNLTGSAVVFITAAAGDIPALYAAETTGSTDPTASGTLSVAIGSSAAASGTDAVSIGTSSKAGTYSVGIGTSSGNIGPNNVIIGRNATTYTQSSVVIGHNADANDYGSNQAAIGYEAKAMGTGATALVNSYASGSYSFAAAIATNSSSYGATGSNSIAIGYQAKATNTYGATFGGFRCQTTGVGAASLGGFDNVASGGYSTVVGGRDSTADALYSYALGYGSHTQGVERRMAFAGSASNGNMQSGYFCLAKNTTDATATALVTNVYPAASTTNQIILPNNSAYSFSGTIVARESATDGTDCAAWEVKGLIRREGSAGTTVLVNSATTVIDNTPSWGMALSADTTNGGLAITVTGAAATNIRWVATIHTSECTYA